MELIKKKKLFLVAIMAIVTFSAQDMYSAEAAQVGLIAARQGAQLWKSKLSLIAEAHKTLPLSSFKNSPLLGAATVLNGTLSRELKYGNIELAGAFLNQVGEEPIRYTVRTSNVARALTPKLIGELVALHDSRTLYEPGFLESTTCNDWAALKEGSGHTATKFKKEIKKLLNLMEKENSEKVREILLAAAYFKISTEDDLTAFLSASGIDRKEEVSSENKQLMGNYADTFLELAKSKNDVSFLQAQEIQEMKGFCGEKALWSVLNMIFYNPETQLLDLTILPENVQKSCLPVLREFIEKYSNPKTSKFYSLASKDFLNLVHGIEGVRYVRSIVEIPGERSETLKILNHLLGTQASSYQKLATILSTTERTITFNEPKDENYGIVEVKVEDKKNSVDFFGKWSFEKDHIYFVFDKEKQASINITKVAELDGAIGFPGTLVRLIPGWLHKFINWEYDSAYQVEEILKNNKVTKEEIAELSQGLAEKKCTLLHTAIERSRANLVKYFLSKDIDPNKADSNGDKPLILAVKGDDISIVKLLIDAKALVNEKSQGGNTALLCAVNNKNADMVKLLIDAKALVDEKDNKGMTALIYATIYGKIDIVKLLIDAKALVDEKDNKGVTALMYATVNGKTDIVKLLIDAKALVNEKNQDGKTALIYATMYGNADMVKFLINAKALVDEKDNEEMTALMYATIYGKTDRVKLLIDAKALVDEKDNKEMTALMYAAVNGKTDIVNLLIDAKALVNEKNQDGKTALMYAEKNGYMSIVKLLKDVELENLAL